jgi:S-adenosylmethionine:diacylglycerol 3-amino-3-carboxypropyl transferase
MRVKRHVSVTVSRRNRTLATYFVKELRPPRRILWSVSNIGGEAPIAQLAEAADLKSAKSGFESQWGHG